MAENGLSNRGRGQPVKALIGYDREVAEWVRIELGMDSDFGPCSAIGVVHNDKLIAGIVYSQFRHPNIEMSIASTSPRWATKRILNIIFSYPFNQLNCKRVTVLIDTTNQPCKALVQRLGFIYEGTLRDANPEGDAEIWGLLKRECKWHGQKIGA